MCRVSTAPTATAGSSGLNWKKFSLSMSSVSQYPRAVPDRAIARPTSSPPKPPPRMSRRCPAMPASLARSASLPHMARGAPAPRVSVLLPVRDAAPWLATALASLARQTLADHEVIAVDDGSTDASGEILERAARRDPRLVVRHTPARGLPAALGLALSLARAPWVARQDADDVCHRTRLARQWEWLEA